MVARSTSGSKKQKNTSRSKHFSKLRCRKSGRRCGATCALWREAHFQVKSAKKTEGSDHFWTFKCCFAWQAQGIVHLVDYNNTLQCIILHYATLHYTTLRYAPLQYTTLHVTLHYTLHYTTLHYATPQFTTATTATSTTTTLLYITLHYITLHIVH